MTTLSSSANGTNAESLKILENENSHQIALAKAHTHPIQAIR